MQHDPTVYSNADEMPNLTPPQRDRVRSWLRLQELVSDGRFGAEMDALFDPAMTYGNPNRPDIGSYAQWKTSPMEMYERFQPCRYRTVYATGNGDDEIWVHSRHIGRQVGRYMGIEPCGQEINVGWFSIVNFRGPVITRIFSIADVLGMLISVGAIARGALGEPFA